MTIIVQPRSFFLFGIAIFALITAILAWNRRGSRGGISLMFTLLLVTGWCAFSAIDSSADVFEQKIFFAKVATTCILFVPTFMLIAVQEILTDSEVAKTHLVTYMVFPILITIIVWTNDLHLLYWAGYKVTNPDLNLITFEHSIFYWINILYQFGILAHTTFMLVMATKDKKSRTKAYLLLCGVMAPWLTTTLYLLGLTFIPNLDISPFGFLITAPVFLVGINQFDLLEIGAAGRITYTDSTKDAIIILNNQENIVDANRSAKKYFGVTKGANINDYPQIATAISNKQTDSSNTYFSNNIEVALDSDWLTLNLTIENTLGKDGSVLGKVMIFRDISYAITLAKGLHEAEILAIQENEQKRLGKEIHDRISQGLYSLSLFSATAKNHALRGNYVAVMEVIDDINGMAQQVIKETNLLFYELEPESFFKIGIVKALTEQAEVIANRYDVRIKYHFNFTNTIPLDFQKNLYNIISEINNHVLNLSRPDEIIISLTDVSDHFKIEVAILDNKMIKSVLTQNHIDKFDNLIDKFHKLDARFEIIDATPGKKFIIVELPILYL
jgi:signal transduction histidine kinase